MKLCRFDLISSPGHPRSGLVYGSKVYETDGANPVAVHEWSDVRLLSPLGLPPSVRLFGPPLEDSHWDFGEGQQLPTFQYLNSAALIGPGLALPIAENVKGILCDPCIAAIIGGSGRNATAEEGDGLVLGLTLLCSFHAVGEPEPRSRDLGFAVGPAVTTPDELDDAVTVDERGRRYRFPLSLKVNSEEIVKFDMSALPYTIAELLAYASETCILQQGDLIAVSLGSNTRLLERGDQVQVVCEKLGVLTTRLG